MTVPGRGPGKRLGQARSLLWARSWAFGRYRLPVFAAALAGAIDRHAPAVVHFDDLGVGPFGPSPGRLSIFAPHNVEHRIAQGEALASSGVRRAFALVEARKLRREELTLWRRMPLCLAVSDVDAREMNAGGALRVEVCPNGTDDVPPSPPPRRRPGEPLRLLFLGSASYAPYERGIAWFVKEVLPVLRERVPATLDVVGVPPLRPVQAAGVVYAGRVPDVAEWYERCHAVIVPMFEGSGTRLKMIEAMARGRPVVSTAVGAQGLPLTPGSHFLFGDDVAGFVRALRSVADQCEGDGDALGRMLEGARAAITPLFWPNITARLVETYRAELDRRAQPST